MAQSVLSAPHFHDEEAAYAFVEGKLWPRGPVCPHCKGIDRIGKMSGKSTRIGLYKCYACRKPFTVKMGTVFESSHIELKLWLQAIHLLCASKKGISSNQLHRTLGVTLKTAWFISHRIRLAMTTLGVEPMGGEGSVVEIDETFIGKKKDVPVRRGYAHKHAVMTLVERGKGSRSFHVSGTASADLLPIIKANVSSGTHVMTDEAGQYAHLGKFFTEHDYVRHGAGEYARGVVHTNTVEGFYSVFKRGMKGVYQHCSEKHLHRYVAEFDFRYNNRVRLGVNDTERAEQALMGVVGKRLTYRTTARQVSQIMVDITAISAALSSFKAAKDIAEAMIGLRDASAFKGKLIEFQSKIIEAQNSVFSDNEERSALLERISELEEKMADLKAWRIEKQKYRLQELSPGTLPIP